jgi:hypothetical protein
VWREALVECGIPQPRRTQTDLLVSHWMEIPDFPL